MTKVNITSTNHQVEVDCANEDLGYVIDHARKLFEATRPTEADRPGPGSAGFQSERHPQWDHDTKAPVR